LQDVSLLDYSCYNLLPLNVGSSGNLEMLHFPVYLVVLHKLKVSLQCWVT